MKAKWMKCAKRVMAYALSVAMAVSVFTAFPVTKVEAASVGQLKEGTNYVIVSKRSGKALTVENYSNVDEAKIVQMPVNNYASQVWTLNYDNGYYEIINRYSGKVLDVPEASKEQGVQIIQYYRKNNTNQRWKITDAGNGYCRISPKSEESFALNVYGGSRDDGARIVQWPYDGGDNEVWEFREVSSVKSNPERTLRVTCVGDSITDGYKASGSSKTYPSQMQKILGDKFVVTNVGVSGSTVIRNESNSYSRTSKYKKGLESNPDIVIIMLGTNDSVSGGMNTKERQDIFRRDYAALIEEYRNCGTNPKIFLATPPTSVDKNNNEDDRDDKNEKYIIPIIKDLANQYRLELLDTHTYTGTWTREYLADGLHPNDKGYEKLAYFFGNAVSNHVKNRAAEVKESANYMIVSKGNKMAISVENGSKNNQAGIVQRNAKSADYQTWKLIPTDDGYYIIQNVRSGKVLDVPSGSTKQGTQIIQFDRNNGDNQKWKIEATGDGYWRITPKRAADQSLNIYRNSKNEGDVIVQWKFDGGKSNELWELRKVN